MITATKLTATKLSATKLSAINLAAINLWAINQLRSRALYPAIYPWLMGLAALDVVLTWIVLSLGGEEMNLVARRVIEVGGFAGMAALKFASLGVVLAICEYVGRRQHRVGRRLAEWALVANTAAVTMGCVFLSQYGAAVVMAQFA